MSKSFDEIKQIFHDLDKQVRGFKPDFPEYKKYESIMLSLLDSILEIYSENEILKHQIGCYESIGKLFPFANSIIKEAVDDSVKQKSSKTTN